MKKKKKTLLQIKFPLLKKKTLKKTLVVKNGSFEKKKLF